MRQIAAASNLSHQNRNEISATLIQGTHTQALISLQRNYDHLKQKTTKTPTTLTLPDRKLAAQ
jgi:hypothetical protein